MGVDAQHRLHRERAPQWAKIEDACDSEDALKAHDLAEGVDNRGRYVPVLPGHDRRAKTREGKTVDEYADIFLRYAVYYGQPGIVLDGMLGLLFKNAPAWDGLDPIDADLQNVTLTGRGRVQFAGDVAEEAIKTSWGGVLVDWSEAEARPYQRLYPAASVMNWRREIRDGVPVWTQWVLREEVEEPSADGFGSVSVEQRRVLQLEYAASFTGADGAEREIGREIYVQQVWRQQDDGNGKMEWRPFGGPVIPTRNGEPLAFIPFEPLAQEPRTPPMLGIANMALGHYRNSADFENGTHKAGVPTLGLYGFGERDDVRAGGIIRSTNENAKAEYVMTGGSGCEEIAGAMDRKNAAIAAMASRMLSNDAPKGAETPEAHELRLVGSDARLRKIADRCGSVLSLTCAYHLWWATALELDQAINQASVRLNTAFFERHMGAADLQTFWMLHLEGGMSRRLYEHIKHRGGVAEDGYSPQQEQAEAEAEQRAQAARLPGPRLDGDDEGLGDDEGDEV